MSWTVEFDNYDSKRGQRTCLRLTPER